MTAYNIILIVFTELSPDTLFKISYYNEALLIECISPKFHEPEGIHLLGLVLKNKKHQPY